MKRKILPILLAAALALVGCTASPKDLFSAPAPARSLVKGDMVVRDEIKLTAPDGWHLAYFDDPETDHVASIFIPNQPSSAGNKLDVSFASQRAGYRMPAGTTPKLALTKAVEASLPHADLSPEMLDVSSIGDQPAIGYSLTLKQAGSTQTIEEYFVYRSDGIWRFSLSAPKDGQISSELREAIFNATWTEVAEPNVKFLGPESALEQ